MDPNARPTACSYYKVCLVFIFGSELVHILLKMSSAKNVILGLLLVIERN